MADPIRDFALDDSGDMAVGGGDLSTVAGVAAVKQAVNITVKVILGEIFADQSIGIDYLNQILIKNPDPFVVRQLIRDRIVNIPDVTDVVGANLTVDRAARTGSIKYSIRTVYSTSPVIDSVTLEVP